MNGLPPARGNPGKRPPEWSNLPQDQTAGNTPTATVDNPAPASVAVPGSNATTADTPSPASASAIPASPSNDATHSPHQQQTSAGYRNIDEFVVAYQRSVDGTRYAAIFHCFGLLNSWKLSATNLHV